MRILKWLSVLFLIFVVPQICELLVFIQHKGVYSNGSEYAMDQKFNYFEAVLWMVFSVVCAGLALKKNNGWWFGLACMFLPFGFSDLVEVNTRAWYEPWWLMVWKGACIAGIAFFGWKLYKQMKAAEKASSD